MSKNVQDLCQQQGLTLEDISQKSGLEADRVQAIVLGRWTPSPAERKAIATVFELNPGDIAWGHKTPIQHIYGQGPQG